MIFWHHLQFKNFPRCGLSMGILWSCNFNTSFYGAIITGVRPTKSVPECPILYSFADPHFYARTRSGPPPPPPHISLYRRGTSTKLWDGGCRKIYNDIIMLLKYRLIFWTRDPCAKQWDGDRYLHCQQPLEPPILRLPELLSGTSFHNEKLIWVWHHTLVPVNSLLKRGALSNEQIYTQPKK